MSLLNKDSLQSVSFEVEVRTDELDMVSMFAISSDRGGKKMRSTIDDMFKNIMSRCAKIDKQPLVLWTPKNKVVIAAVRLDVFEMIKPYIDGLATSMIYDGWAFIRATELCKAPIGVDVKAILGKAFR